MNKTQAKEISKSGITVGQIKELLKKVYDSGAANNTRGKVNKSFSKSTIFNIFWKGYVDQKDDKIIYASGCLAASNVLREFGEFWEGELPPKKYKNKPGSFCHTEAINIYEK
jgi:hypothetical protein